MRTRLLTLLLVPLLACGDKGDDTGSSTDGGSTDGSTDDGSTDDGGTDDGGTDDGGTDDGGTTTDGGEGTIRASFFEASATFEAAELVDCELEDGSSTTCLSLRFGSNPVESGPFCPETIDDIAGLGVYDGPTDTGFQLLARPLWEAMEADGYDIVDRDGTIVVENPTGPADGGGPGGGMPATTPDEDVTTVAAEGGAACLDALPDDGLGVVVLVPVVPTLASSADVIGGVELVGVSIDGMPIAGDPPSVVDNGGKIPALDACGNHHDPTGYLHMHLASQGMQPVLDAHGIDEVACGHLPQDDTALVGFAKDGFPLYASQDMDGSTPSDLDECWGHTAPTSDFPDGVYHYHASATEAPNLPPCVKGVAARGALSLE